MTAAIKYRLRAESKKYKNDYRVDILEEGYTGAMQLKRIGAGKLRFRKNDGVIQYTTLSMSIQSDSNFEFIGFFQYNNRKYPVKLYENDTLVWSGYITAESYSEPYINPPYDVQIVATDNLSALKNYKFSNSDMQTRLTAIRHCIDNLGLQLDYAVAIDLFEQNMDGTRAMLDQVYFNGDIFEDEDCETVIKKLLPYGTIITQHLNRWLIRRPLEDAEKTHFVYDYQGNYTGTLTGETVLSMGDLGNAGIWPYAPGALLNMEHAWDDATIIKEYGKRASFVKNYNFGKGNLSNWTNATNTDVFIKKIDETYFAQISGYADYGSDLYIEQGGIDVEATDVGNKFVFKIKYDAIASFTPPTFGNYRAAEPTDMTVRFMVKIVGTSQTLYLSKTGWTETETIIEQNITSSMVIPEWKSLEIVTDNVPIDGNLIVRLYRYNISEAETYYGVSNNVSIKGIVFTDIEIFTSELIELDTTEETEITIIDDAADVNEKIELKPVDLPDIENSRLLLSNGNYYLSGGSYYLTRFWSNNGGNALLFDDLLEAQLINYYGQPRQRLTGCDWRGTGLHLNAVAQHIANYERVFVAGPGVWEILDDTWNIEWIEKPASASENAEWILEDGVWGDSGEIWVDTETWEDTDVDVIEISVTRTDATESYDITSQTGITTGDVIETLPATPGVNDALYEDGAVIASPPHTFGGTTLYYFIPEAQSTDYQTSFTATIAGQLMTIQIVYTDLRMI